MTDSIQNQAKKIQERLVEWRRHFHQHPEIGLEVPETAGFIQQELTKLGLEVRAGVGGHGVVATITGDKPGKCIAIRSDMDALPIREDTGLSFASQTEGRMHACGHDAHMAMALGAASLLSRNKGEIAGSVKFLFQPAEEGPGGAKPMIEDGALENPKVDAVIGLHTGSIWKDAEPGDVYVSRGPMMACLDRVDIKIKGKGGHGAMPHETVDAISIASQVLSNLQTIVSRETSPSDPAVITIGKMSGGVAFNVIAEEVVLEGTVRAMNQELREFLDERIEAIVKGITTASRGSYEYKYTYGYPPLVNDASFTEEFEKVAKEIVGPEKVKPIPVPTMGGEDMAYFLQAAPGTFFFLAGSNREKGQVYPHHHSKFDIDEDMLYLGPALFSAMAVRWLIDHA